MGKLARRTSAAGVLLVVIGLFNGAVFGSRKAAPKPAQRHRRITAADLESAYREAAADPFFVAEMDEVVRDFDVALGDTLIDRGVERA